jgi:circadian clock protein KaiC
VETDVERVATGIAGLDRILGGGPFRGSMVVLAGPPGTGKTILAQQMCFAAVSRGEKAIYYTTLSEPHSKLIAHLENFRFFDHAALGNGMEMIDIDPLARERGLVEATAEVLRRSFTVKPAVVVIDSIKALGEISGEEGFRKVLYDLASRVAHSEAVLLLVGEYTLEDVASAPEFAVADGIVYLALEPSGTFDRRWLRVLKLRGSEYLSGKHSMDITSSGVEVFPRIEAAPPVRVDAPEERLSTGIPRLDQMMGGGLPATNATLVAGPSGVGKTVISLHFVAEGLARGERCLFLTFQENEKQLVRKARHFGWDLAGSDGSRPLTIRHLQPVELGLDMLAAQMQRAMLDGPMHRVVVDSLTEIAHAARGTDRFPDYLWTFVEIFRGAGATSMLTMETTSFFGPSFELGSGLSAAVDNVILLRYTELDSEMRRALSVVKMRESAHTKTLVQIEIGHEGLTVIGKFPAMTGILTGTPVPPTVGGGGSR